MKELVIEVMRASMKGILKSFYDGIDVFSLDIPTFGKLFVQAKRFE